MKNEGTQSIMDNMKKCSICGKIKPLSEFYQIRRTSIYKKYYMSHCIECAKRIRQKKRLIEKQNKMRMALENQKNLAPIKADIDKEKYQQAAIEVIGYKLADAFLTMKYGEAYLKATQARRMGHVQKKDI